MSGGPEAFEFESACDDLQDKVECLLPWQSLLLVGAADGSLSVFDIPDQDAEDPTLTLSQRIKGFSKRALVQLDVIPTKPALLSLSDDGVHLHTLPDLAPICTVAGTRGASRFAWNQEKLTLAVAVKRKLAFHHLTGVEFMEMTTMAVPDVPLVLGWCGDAVCAGFRKEYVLANPNTGSLGDLFTVGRAMKPSVTPVPGANELLLAKENFGMFIGRDGRPTRRPSSALTWSEAPLAVAVSPPYVLAAVLQTSQNFIEVRNLSPSARKGVVQMFHVEGPVVLAQVAGMDGSVYLASKTKKALWKLRPTALGGQVEELMGMGEFPDALELCGMMPEDQRGGTEDLLRVRYGAHLFSEGDYDEGMAQLAMHSCNTPVLFLKLFPSLTPPAKMKNFPLPVPDDLFSDMREPQGEERVKAVSALLPYLLSHRSRLATRRREDLEMDDEQHRLGPEVGAEMAESGEERDQAVGESGTSDKTAASEQVMSRLHRSRQATLVDTAILKGMLVCPDTGALLQFVQQPNFVDMEEGRGALVGCGRYAELAALYQSRGHHSEGLELLRRLSQSPQSFDVEPQGVASGLSGEMGVWAVVRYLSTLTEKDAAVIQQHATWVLKQDAEAALQMFICSEKRLPPAIVLPILRTSAPQYSSIYLEVMLDCGEVSHEEYDGTLMKIYLREALENEQEIGCLGQPSEGESLDSFLKSVASEELRESMKNSSQVPLFTAAGPKKMPTPQELEDAAPSPSQSYQRLKQLIMTSPYIDPSTALASIPSGRLFDLQALLMEKLGRHKEALEVYAQELHSLELAEALCDRVYESSKGAGRGDIYMMLLEIYLGVKDGPNPPEWLNHSLWRQLFHMLSRKRYRIDAEKVFGALPFDLCLCEVMPFVEACLRTLAEQQRNVGVAKNLYSCENLEVKERLIKSKQRMVHATSERACHMCKKRIGSAVLVAYPNDNLAHYSCYRRGSQT
eukprot:evm.model.scf_3833.1 EVM.evm.TU.scf_3833.1   scf_3833:4766-7651(-)